MTSATTLTAGEITAGDELPVLSVDVTATTVVLGALASRDYRPMHHDKDFAQNQGVKNIFLNTPTQAAWFERYLTDWTGPLGRVGRLRFKMRGSICPGDALWLTGRVDSVETDAAGACWVDLTLQMRVDDNVATECAARIAVPVDAGDNPWQRPSDQWKP
jgi:hypothetical protein